MTEPATPDAAEAAKPAEAQTEPAARVAELEAEAAKLKDQLLRALAEQENIRRRGEREREDVRKFAATGFAKDLLSAADNLRRALESMPDAKVVDEPTRNLLAGVAATERELLGAFEKNGIRRLDPAGEKFDHNLHQAMFELENTGKPAGTIVQVLQAGYVLNERLLRPAMVGVAKGNPGPAPEAEPAKDEPGSYQRVDRTA